MGPINMKINLGVLGPHTVRLPHGDVADELADVLHVVYVLREQVALHLQSVRVRSKASSFNRVKNICPPPSVIS